MHGAKCSPKDDPSGRSASSRTTEIAKPRNDAIELSRGGELEALWNNGSALRIARDREAQRASTVHRRLDRAALFAAALITMCGSAEAAPCGNTGAGFEAWKPVFANEARARGVGPKAIAALMDTTYSVGTIRADRGQHSFKLSLDAFMAKRGAPAIAAKG